MRRDCPASFHFSNKLCTAKRRSRRPLSLSLSLSFLTPLFAPGLWEERGEKGQQKERRTKRG